MSQRYSSTRPRSSQDNKEDNATGFVLYSGKSMIDKQPIVVIATLHSANEKTGDMVQVWILPRQTSPLSALKNNNNAGA